jgi:hypothetical protein
MPYRFNPPPNWPIDDPDWTPPPGWQPDPAWGPVPEGWNFWVDAEQASAPASAPEAEPAPVPEAQAVPEAPPSEVTEQAPEEPEQPADATGSGDLTPAPAAPEADDDATRIAPISARSEDGADAESAAAPDAASGTEQGAEPEDAAPETAEYHAPTVDDLRDTHAPYEDPQAAPFDETSSLDQTAPMTSPPAEPVYGVPEAQGSPAPAYGAPQSQPSPGPGYPQQQASAGSSPYGAASPQYAPTGDPQWSTAPSAPGSPGGPGGSGDGGQKGFFARFWWLIACVVLLIVAALILGIGLLVWQPWAGPETDPTTPATSSEEPTDEPTDEPTEEPTDDPTEDPFEDEETLPTIDESKADTIEVNSMDGKGELSVTMDWVKPEDLEVEYGEMPAPANGDEYLLVTARMKVTDGTVSFANYDFAVVTPYGGTISPAAGTYQLKNSGQDLGHPYDFVKGDEYTFQVIFEPKRAKGLVLEYNNYTMSHEWDVPK